MLRIPRIPECEITPRSLYLRRREFLALGAATAISAALGPSCAKAEKTAGKKGGAKGEGDAAVGEKLDSQHPGTYDTDETKTPFEDVTTYNNFYEFGTDKGDPAAHAATLHTRPWSLSVEGEVGKPRIYDLDELIHTFPLEERVYRMRCVEAWSMVIPWIGFPLHRLLEQAEPTEKAKYVAFTSLLRPEEMPGQKRRVLDWPYVEGLRLDEAMHPLALLAVGLYGETLPNQNGAPVRLVVPWKYGFKGIKSIVRIRLTESQPRTSWNLSGPTEYGFYANVNPEVDHPRWSQATERRIGEFRRRPTLPFNGYGELVSSLYQGMDLRKNF